MFSSNYENHFKSHNMINPKTQIEKWKLKYSFQKVQNTFKKSL